MAIYSAKPPAGATPDFKHPHAYGLRNAFLLNERSGQTTRDAVTGMHGFLNGTAAWGTGLHGGCVHFNGGLTDAIINFSSPFYSAGILGADGNSHPFGIVAGVRQTGSQSGFQSIFTHNSQGLYITGGQVQFYQDVAAGEVLVVNQPYVVGVSARGTSGTDVIDYVVNGRLGAQVSGSQTSIDQLAGIGGGANGSPFIGDISFLYLYDRYIPLSVMASIQADPFAMFAQADIIRIWDAAAGSGAALPVTGTGALTISRPVLTGTGIVIDVGSGGITISAPKLSGVGTASNPFIRNTQEAIEDAEVFDETSVRLDQYPVEDLERYDLPNVRHTQMPVEDLEQYDLPRVRMTQIVVELMFPFACDLTPPPPPPPPPTGCTISLPTEAGGGSGCTVAGAITTE